MHLLHHGHWIALRMWDWSWTLAANLGEYLFTCTAVMLLILQKQTCLARWTTSPSSSTWTLFLHLRCIHLQITCCTCDLMTDVTGHHANVLTYCAGINLDNLGPNLLCYYSTVISNVSLILAVITWSCWDFITYCATMELDLSWHSSFASLNLLYHDNLKYFDYNVLTSLPLMLQHWQMKLGTQLLTVLQSCTGGLTASQ